MGIATLNAILLGHRVTTRGGGFPLISPLHPASAKNMPTLNKAQLLHQVIAHLETALSQAQQAAQTAYEAATDEENIAENKYDTLGLEASYLATGQARRPPRPPPHPTHPQLPPPLPL